MVSITQGSYAPESYMTDGYESEPYLTSIGSSASRAAFRDGRDSHTIRLDIQGFHLVLNQRYVYEKEVVLGILFDSQYLSVSWLH